MTGFFRRAIGIFCLLFPFTVTAQSADNIRLFLQNEPVVEGELFAIFVEMPREYISGLRVTQPPNSDRMRFWGGEFIYSSSEYEIPEDYFLIRYRYMPDVAGFTLFPGLTLTWPEARIESGPLLVPVRTDGDIIPPELEWNIPEGPVYEGQTVYISLDMHRAKEILFPDTLSIETPRDAILEEVTGLGALIEYEFAGEMFNRIPLATFLYTPLRSGNLSIPSARVIFGGYERVVSRESLPVRALSEPQRLQNGAVGDFTLSTSETPRNMRMGEELVFVLSIAGRGSLGVLQLPDIEVLNGTIEGRDQSENYSPTEEGYAGSQSRSYRIRPDEVGTMQIRVPEFTWFDPSAGEIRSQSPRNFSIRIDQREGDGERAPRFSELKYDAPTGIAAIFPLYLSNSFTGMVFIVLIPLSMLLYVLLKRKSGFAVRMGMTVFILISLGLLTLIGLNLYDFDRLESQRQDFVERAVESAQVHHLTRGRLLAEMRPWDNRLLFHLAQIEYLAGNTSRSLVLVRRAVGNSPMAASLRNALELLEGEMELTRQFGIPRILHDDWAFLLLWACLITSGFALLRRDFRPRWNASMVIAMVVMTVTVISAVTMGVMFRQNISDQTPVIREGGVMVKKIPDADAENWIFLPEGTTVQTKVENSGYVQIETAYGIVAWIPVDGVYISD